EEWFELALERRLHESIEGAEVGNEIRQLGREDNPTATLKSWESHGLLGSIHSSLQKRRPDYENLAKLARARDAMAESGVRPRLFAPITLYTLHRLKDREMGAALRHLELRQAEIDSVLNLKEQTEKVLKVLKGSKTNAPRDAYNYLTHVPQDILTFVQAEKPNPRALSKIRNYLQKWRPLRAASPVAELDSLGIPRGPKFDKILEDLFEMQLRGRARDPEDRTKSLRKLAGIKPEPVKKAKDEKEAEKEKGRKRGKVAADLKAKGKERHDAATAEAARKSAPAKEAKPAEKVGASKTAKAAARKPSKASYGKRAHGR
ncbi:MAG: hypothetical protein ACRD4K_13690, partial [Candidatus Acidiferrales bacterium]